MGENAKQGQTGTLSRQKIREQAELHTKAFKSKNKKERVKKQLNTLKIKQPKVSMGGKKTHVISQFIFLTLGPNLVAAKNGLIKGHAERGHLL